MSGARCASAAIAGRFGMEWTGEQEPTPSRHPNRKSAPRISTARDRAQRQHGILDKVPQRNGPDPCAGDEIRQGGQDRAEAA